MYEYRYPRRIYVGYFENETGESWASIRDAMGFSADPEPLIEDAVQYVRKDVADELLEALENCLGFVVAHPQFTDDLRNLIAKAKGVS